MPYGVSYAGAESDYESADAVIFGIPYDHTASYKAGAREGPTAIRRASYNFEEIHFEHGLDQPVLNVHDYGNCDDFFLPQDMMDEVRFAVGPAVRDGKFTIAMGGEHSATFPIVESYDSADIALITIDAHLDSRDEYMGSPYSHACVTRRASEHLGLGNVYALGVRAVGAEELDREDVVPFVTSYDIMDRGIAWAVEKALNEVENERIYLSIDIDGIDPAYAPGTGTPEPFGITPMDVKKTINLIGGRLAAFDVMEVCPPADPSGITSILASRLINEALAVYAKHNRE
ncbi:MAG: agmatinase [Candidatus Methanomethylophilaceae archaeon]|nr:agmatinase [Candidatus Methanomethylophilaceae archaeon]